MTIALPSAYEFGKVVARILHAVGDTTADDDELPQARPAQGSVTFTPDETMRVVTDPGETAIITQADITATFDAQGNLVGAEGTPGVWLPVGDYVVAFNLEPVAGIRTTIPTRRISVTVDHDAETPLDLATAMPYIPPAGVTVRTMSLPAGGFVGQAPVLDGGLELAWQYIPSQAQVDEIANTYARRGAQGRTDLSLGSAAQAAKGVANGVAALDADGDVVNAAGTKVTAGSGSDPNAVKLTGDQTIAGVKTFSAAPVVPDGSFAIGKTSGLQTALDGKVDSASVDSIVALTQAAYDALTPDARTLYVITEE